MERRDADSDSTSSSEEEAGQSGGAVWAVGEDEDEDSLAASVREVTQSDPGAAVGEQPLSAAFQRFRFEAVRTFCPTMPELRDEELAEAAQEPAAASDPAARPSARDPAQLEQEARSLVQVDTMFDMEDFAEGRRRRERERRHVPPHGTLAQVFGFYARLFSASKQYGSADLTYEAIEAANSTMSMGEFLFFAHDFGIVPSLLRKSDVVILWGLRNAVEGAEDTDDRYADLTFEEFVAFLVLVALVAHFPDPGLHGATTHVAASRSGRDDAKASLPRPPTRGPATEAPAARSPPRRVRLGSIRGFQSPDAAARTRSASTAPLLRTGSILRGDNIVPGVAPGIARAMRHARALDPHVRVRLLITHLHLRDRQAVKRILRTVGRRTQGRLNMQVREARAAPGAKHSNFLRKGGGVQDTFGGGDSADNGREGRRRIKDAVSQFSTDLYKLLYRFRHDPPPRAWTRFHAPYLDAGLVRCGDARSLRIVIRNVSDVFVSVRAELEDVPDAELLYSLKPLAPGLVRTAEVRFEPQGAGAFAGRVLLHVEALSPRPAVPEDAPRQWQALDLDAHGKPRPRGHADGGQRLPPPPEVAQPWRHPSSRRMTASGRMATTAGSTLSQTRPATHMRAQVQTRTLRRGASVLLARGGGATAVMEEQTQLMLPVHAHYAPRGSVAAKEGAGRLPYAYRHPPPEVVKAQQRTKYRIRWSQRRWAASDAGEWSYPPLRLEAPERLLAPSRKFRPMDSYAGL